CRRKLPSATSTRTSWPSACRLRETPSAGSKRSANSWKSSGSRSATTTDRCSVRLLTLLRPGLVPGLFCDGKLCGDNKRRSPKGKTTMKRGQIVSTVQDCSQLEPGILVFCELQNAAFGITCRLG